MANDLFAPPSPEELKAVGGQPARQDMFAPPTKHELIQAKAKEMLSPSAGPVPGKDASMTEKAIYYGQKNPMYPPPADTSVRGLTQNTFNALPGAGAAVGSMAGGGLLSYPAAVAGGAIGTIVKRLGEQYVLGKKPEEQPEFGQDLIESVPNSLMQNAMGRGIGAAGEYIAGKGAKPSAEAPKVMAAAKKLEVKPTAGMLTDDYTARNTENSLSQSPTIPGQWIRNEQAPVYGAQQEIANKATQDANSQTPFDAGRQIKKSIVDYVDSKNEPIKKSYDEIETHTKNIPVEEGSLNRVGKNIGNIDEARFQGSPGQRVASSFQKMLSGAQDINDIKLLRTKAQRIATNSLGDPEEKAAASAIYDKLDRLLTNSTKRGAINVARGAQPDYDAQGRFVSGAAQEEGAQTEGMAIGKKLLSDLKVTGKQYGQLMDDINTIGKNSGLSKPKAGKGPQGFKNDIESRTNEEMAPALFDQENVTGLRHLQEKVPAAFETARQQKLNEIVDKSTGRDGKVDPVKLQRVIDGINPEVQDILFGNENVQNLKAAKTLQQATPTKVGASDTPRGIAFSDMLTPQGLLRNISDLGRYGFLKARANAPKVGSTITKYSQPAAAVLKRGLLDER